MVIIIKFKRKKPKIIIVISVLLAVSLLLCVCFYKMHPVIMRYAVSVAETIMLNSANEAVVKILEEENVTYSDISVLNSNAGGYVTSAETDIYKVNYLKSKISNKISELVDNREYYDVKIPIGTFFGNTYTSGFGPRLKFKMQLTSTAFVDFSHEFKAAGINQVLHLVTVDIKIRGSLVIVGYNKPINVQTSAIAAQTVIVGKTPDSFTNVIENEDDNTAGLINDYGGMN